MNRLGSVAGSSGSNRLRPQSARWNLVKAFHGVRTELQKALTLRSMWILSIAVLLFVIWYLYRQLSVLEQEIALRPGISTVELVPREVETIAQVIQRFSLASVVQASTVIFALGIIMSRQEYRGGQLSISLLAMPRRVRTYCSKVTAVVLVSTGFSVVLLTVVNAEIFLLVHRAETEVLYSQQAFWANLRFIMFVNCTTIVAMSLTTITRNAVTPILFFLTSFVLTGNTQIPGASNLSPWLLPAAGSAFVFGSDSVLDPLFNGQELLVLCLWPLVTFAVGHFTFVRRDTL